MLELLPRDSWPTLLRDDSGFGNEGIMREAEARLTKNVTRLIEKLGAAREWVYVCHCFQAKESAVRLVGWSRERRVIVLRRRLKGAVGLSYNDASGTPQLSFAEIGQTGEAYEYWVLVTSLEEETEAFGQPYRDRGLTGKISSTKRKTNGAGAVSRRMISRAAAWRRG